MRKNTKNFDVSVQCLSEDKTIATNEIKKQSTLSINKHQVEKGYLVLSKNDFGIKYRVNVGYFNKKTNFRISEKDSLLVLDKDTTEIKNIPVQEILDNFRKYFLIYMPAATYFEKENKNITKVRFKSGLEEAMIPMTFIMGYATGLYIKEKSFNYIKDAISKKYNYDLNKTEIKFIKNIVEINKEKIVNPDDPNDIIYLNKKTLDKRLVTNTNSTFLIGILSGITDFGKEKLIFNDINNYTITGILNSLGASYSVRYLPIDQENQKSNIKFFHIRFKLPFYYFKKIYDELNQIELNEEKIFEELSAFTFFRLFGYIIENDKVQYKKFKNFKDNKENIISIINYFEEIDYLYKNNKINETIKMINENSLLLIPIKDLKFIPEENFEAYDIVTEGRDGNTNFILPSTPLLKNSDGDILAVVALHTPEAAKNAEKSFGIKTKENLVNSLTGKPTNWITNDAVLGLYEFTK